jgi:hypothetical protein
MRSRTLAAPSPGRVFLIAAVAAFGMVVALFALTSQSRAGGASSGREPAALKAQLASAERDAKFWRQLTSAFVPGKQLGLNSMADHMMRRTPGGPVLALHFDKMNLDRAQNLNWVAYALPGRFTRADQARLNRLYGPGFTHFHSFRNDAHGGPVGTRGVWFVHIGTRNFRSPFGQVRAGKVDLNFMPTRPPAR